ncbi:hypothetical protein COOONC_06931 [Cooperia oncophora]
MVPEGFAQPIAGFVQMPNQMGFLEASMSSTIRKGVLLGAVVSAGQIFSGSVASASYSTRFYYDITYDDDDEAIQEYWDMVPEGFAQPIAGFVQMPNQMGFLEASMSSTIRKGVLLGAVVSAGQIFSGSVASASYSTR